MFKKIISQIFSKKNKGATDFDVNANVEAANELRNKGDLHGAILLYKECLTRDSTNVHVINALGCCLWDVGDEREGLALFELAYSLDDEHIPAVVNYARALIDKKRTSEAVALLERAVVCEPGFSNTYTLYASILFARGNAVLAKDFYLKGWLGNFDSLRLANGYFFPLSYVEEDQRTLAAEHQFWGETVRVIDLEADRIQLCDESREIEPVPPLPNFPSNRKIRIGYWSPDLRSHSVRFFFRPMLEGHSKERFEVFLYHDSFMSDSQTEAMKSKADHFHDVYLLNDVDLYELMRSHQLDVIVEMAGHTSANRLALFRSNRLATLQLTGVGYPPTTGLSTIDAKILDPYVASSCASDFYTEKPLILPSSFWCFDPLEDGDIECAENPPVEGNGYITFACIGNISKISSRILSLWVRILDQVPESRLLIRSINFEDPTARDAFVYRVECAGLDMARVDIAGAQPAGDLFRSYNGIDIVLDTFPFNGGTTSCFATYMGVPVVTLVGESLVGRMGLSILENLGAAHCAVYNDEEYVQCAVSLASDRSFLGSFRRRARAGYKSTALGNGRIFMPGFEAACEEFLKNKNRGLFSYESTVPHIPANELARRLYCVNASGNGEAAQRILEYGLRQYPNYAGFHLFIAQNMHDQGREDDAFDYLNSRLDEFSDLDKVSSLVAMAGWCLLRNDESGATFCVERASALGVNDEFDRLQLRLYSASLKARCQNAQIEHDDLLSRSSTDCGLITVLIPCDDSGRFAAMRNHMTESCRIPLGWSVRYIQCQAEGRGGVYDNSIRDGVSSVLVIMQPNVKILLKSFFERVLAGLSCADVIGVAGAKRWVRSHWRGDKFGQKCAGFFTEGGGHLWLQCLGDDDAQIVSGQRVLEGALLAVNCKTVSFADFDPELAAAGWAMEEDWSFGAAERGARLAVHRNLGVLIAAQPEQDSRQRYPGLLRLQEKYQFPLFQGDVDDGMMLSVPVIHAAHGMESMNLFCVKEL